MVRQFSKDLIVHFLVFLAAFLVVTVPPACAQHGSEGAVTVTVLDQSGGRVPAARLELLDLATNDLRSVEATESGAYSFVNLSVGTYKLTVSHAGYATQIFNNVLVHATQTTDVSVTLRLAPVVQTVEVSIMTSPIVETTSSAIGTVIDMKQIEDLPLAGRDLQQLTHYVPGYAGDGLGGTWNGLPGGAQGNNIDGVIGASSRFKDFGNGDNAAVSPRVEDIQEMTIQTDQIDLNQGFGQATMQVNYVTRRGTNKFHGRVYDDYQGSALDANSWINNAYQTPKAKFHLNDFGVSVGGPILKDKLFFFGSYSESKQPGAFSTTNNLLVPAAQAGNFTYTDTNGATQTVNVLQVAAHNGLNSTIDSVVGTEISNINGVLKYGQLAGTSDPNVLSLQWLQPNPVSWYFPSFRLDYDLSEKFRINWAFNETKNTQPGYYSALFPGQSSVFKYQIQGYESTAYTAALGFEWTIRPTLINELRGGFLYNYGASSYNAGNAYQQGKNVLWQMPTMNWQASGDFVETEISNFYPLFNLSDTMTWQRGKHTINFGGSWYREQDHYWNPPIGYPWICLGLAGGDPALNAFTNGPTGTVPNASPFSLGEAEQLYAVLAGRVTCANGNHPLNPATKQYGTFGAYNLDELQQAWGLFYQDSFHLRPNLTFNYGLRWDFTGDDHDLTEAYHGVLNPADLFGPSGLWNEFNPGSLPGNQNPQYVASGHQYTPWHVSPQPLVGLAWSPHFDHGFLSKAAGGDPVIRAGYSLRRFTPAYQDFWSYASNYGSFFFQGFTRSPGTPTATSTGVFTPGSLQLENWQNWSNPGDPSYVAPLLYPATYTTVIPESSATFTGQGLAGMNPHIHQPYMQSWNVGIQRKLGTNNALEVRYVGNRGTHLWLGLNINEVNIFENGFLAQFKAAQKNLAIYQQANPQCSSAGTCSFANNKLSGQQALPIFQAAFAGEGPGPDGQFADYSAGNFVQWLLTGQAGAMAGQLTSPFGTAAYFCNLVGASFNPCSNPANGVGYTGAGAGYPINFFQVNPYESGGGVGYLNSIGYSTNHALQVEFRQNQWHGMQFNANYTWSHTLGLGNPSGYDGTFPMYTLRNLRLNYGPAQYDLRHTLNASGTYDLPFGKGKAFVDRGGVLNRVVGGWTVGTIFNFQTGFPERLQGGFSTFNNVGDGGIVLNGVTMSELQSSVHVTRAYTGSGSGKTLLPFMNFLDSKYLASTAGGANPAFILPNTTPGTFGLIPYLYGPHRFNTDLSLTKRVPIREDIKFTFQTEFLNAFNHTNFSFLSNSSSSVTNPNINVQNPAFGTLGPFNGPRAIEMRANIEF